MLKVDKIINGGLLEICYFVHDEDNKEGFLVDPGYGVERILNFLMAHSYKAKYILLTHGHFDHILGVPEIVKKHSSKLYVPMLDVELLSSVEHSYASMLKISKMPIFNVDRELNDGDTINILDHDITCISTPGHTKGSMSYYMKNENILFSGDALFFGTYGRVDFYGGNVEDMENSLKNKLFKLPEDCKVYPGHGEETTIGYEMKNNEIWRI